jgi:hypothetical protein
MSALQRAMLRVVGAQFDRAAASVSNSPTVDRSIDQLTWGRHYLPHYFRKQPSEMHRWMAAELHAARKQRGSKINVVGPRGGAKSTVANTSYILRCAVEGTEPYILILGRTEGLAAKHLSHIKRELTDNVELARDYPEACGRGPVWSESEIRLRNGVQIQAFGAGQSLRGARNAADRPTLVVGDDIQEEDVITSKATRDRDWAWFTGAVLKIGTRETNFVNLCNALHREAIGSRLTVTPGWESKEFASIIRWPENMGLWEQWSEKLHNHDDSQAEATAEALYAANRAAMEDGAEVLWPDQEDLYALMFMRETEGRNTFERDKQARVASVESNEWPDSYFDDHIWFEQWPERMRVRVLALDPSKGKDSKRGDYSAFVHLGIGFDGLIYVEADLDRRPPSQIVADGVAIYSRIQPDAFGVEANAWQDLLCAEFGRQFVEAGLPDPEPYAINNNTAKVVRIRKLGPLLGQKRLRFKRGSPGTLLTVSQMRDFPDQHAHDDGPDAVEMAYRLACQLLAGDDDDDAEEQVTA